MWSGLVTTMLARPGRRQMVWHGMIENERWRRVAFGKADAALSQLNTGYLCPHLRPKSTFNARSVDLAAILAIAG